MINNIIKDVKEVFVREFSTEPLLIFSPGRINIIGEHTDYNEGFVFPAAIDKGIVTGLQKSCSNQCKAIALELNSTVSFELNNIKPIKSDSWTNYIFGVIDEIQKINKEIGNFNVVIKGNVPEGAGMSSSAALENSIVYGLNKLFDLGLSKHEMILISQRAEHNYVGVKCGIMDQYASMCGVKNHALHLDCRTIQSKSYKIDFRAYQFVLINTNVKHSLADSAYNNRRSVCEQVARLLKVEALRDASEKDLEAIKEKITPADYQKALYVIQENKRTIEASRAIERGDLGTLGLLMYQSHLGLSTMYKVSCEELDFLVDKAKLNKNILGARMMGGGFGGCTINLIAKNEVENFKNQISQTYQSRFNKTCSIYEIELSDGTHVIPQRK